MIRALSSGLATALTREKLVEMLLHGEPVMVEIDGKAHQFKLVDVTPKDPSTLPLWKQALDRQVAQEMKWAEEAFRKYRDRYPNAS
jgi:hypothetical protein